MNNVLIMHTVIVTLLTLRIPRVLEPHRIPGGGGESGRPPTIS